MRHTMIWLIGIAGAVVLLIAVIALSPKGQPQVGISNGQLRTCPGSPNCVSSEFGGEAFYIAPLAFTGDRERAWSSIREAVRSAGGAIQSEGNGYLWATFTSRVLRFVDDLELRMDADNSVIHVRSASRVGYSDLGVNRKRVEQVRSLFSPTQSQE